MLAKLMKRRRDIAWIRKRLARDRNRYWQSLCDRRDHAVAVELSEALGAREATPEALIVHLVQRINALVGELDDAQQLFQRYQSLWSRASSQKQARRLMREYCERLTTSPSERRRDRDALERYLDEDALLERHNNRLGRLSADLHHLCERLGALGPEWIEQEGEAGWRRLGLARLLLRFLGWQGDQRVRSTALVASAELIAALPPESHDDALGDEGLSFVSRACLDPGIDIDVQIAAMELLLELSPADFDQVVERRLANDAGGEDFFVRVAILHLLARKGVVLERHLELALADPSPHVRLRTAEMLWRFPTELVEAAVGPLARDAEPSVRLAVLGRLHRLVDRAENPAELLTLAVERLHAEPLTEGQLAVLEAISALLMTDGRDADFGDQIKPALPLHRCLLDLRKSAEALVVRRKATQLLNELWLLADPARARAYRAVRATLPELPLGRRRRIRLGALAALNAEDQMRILAIANRAGHPLSLRLRDDRVVSLRRGERFGFRFWRWWFELRHPSTDKRQAHRHTKGRIYHDLDHVSSGRLAELSQTRVPGEPLYVEEEGGGRPYLPLLDQVLSSLDQGWPTRPMRLVSDEGITEVVPPSGVWARLKARAIVSHRFARIAALRNWREGAGESAPDSYARALAELGFRVRLLPHRLHDGQRMPRDPSVARFFPAVFPLPFGDWAERIWQHFLSVYQNSLWHLSVFMAAVVLVFFGRHAVQNRLVARSRRRIPLVIGGWGTRGKSGTERLKAALFTARGESLICKTTGCEAMWLYAQPFQPIRELFLFRPYDKATIWEQAFVARLAARAKVSVLLWECMGLTPSYVKVLRDWMRDDLATITNTYPDHEDVQGPAGYEIPTVMQCFIPKGSTLLTTEHQMLPILEAGTRKVGTELIAVPEHEARVIAPDVLSRFSYEEHPSNIALVLRLAEQLGFHKDEALRAMTRFVVPDLGVLKTYPTTRLDQRELTFLMGMSANERFAALSNWRRMRLDRIDPMEEPEKFIVAVVNNRADRVPRSQVFAHMLTDDLSFDVAVLIGTNVSGLVGFIETAWEERIGELFHGRDEDSATRLKDLMVFLRLPTSRAQLDARLDALVERLADSSDSLPHAGTNSLERVSDPNARAALSEWFEGQKALLERFETLVARSPDESQWLAFCRDAMAAKIVRVDNPQLDGNAVNRIVGHSIPPGADGRVMGLQNIKGTGLDFVYRWVAWETCHKACEQIHSGHVPSVRNGLSQLMGIGAFNLLMIEPVERALERASRSPCGQEEAVRADIEVLKGRLSRDRERFEAQSSDASDATVKNNRWLDWIEQLLDAGDAVKRRKKANRIYQDMINERISSTRAADELLALTKRQKGGWLGR